MSLGGWQKWGERGEWVGLTAVCGVTVSVTGFQMSGQGRKIKALRVKPGFFFD